ncbi:uncharacterized protein LOC120190984 isoform X2 [Hibiscus syriacus]|uniref:uncharacterized protein LOC120190984 isoform X2 n=1 Tax=Hibiscus syriacus TaxID=106335 RepID=UPI0019247618|nr:uncharacterized protein LOC120190984 isoform X2 [Hibiscus syriacus]
MQSLPFQISTQVILYPPKSSRYCSNLYPKAESYEVCNWCLSQNVDSKSQNSSTSSPSCKVNNEDDGKNKRKGDYNNDDFKDSQRNKNLKKQFASRQKFPEKRPPCTTRRRIISNGRLDEKLRTRKAEEVSKGVYITRQVFRNKVQRYKHLDEVSS